MSGVSILIVGFLLGLKHATEADHLVAVAALASGQSSLSQALRQGLAWGLGHALMLMLLGGAVLALGKSLPAQFEPALEAAVGVMLIALGVDVLRRLARKRMHFHVHSHAPGAARHVHAHTHTALRTKLPAPSYGSLRFVEHRQAAHLHQPVPGLPLRALAVGMMHGMAGSAALILLSLQAVQSFSMGMLYIALFGAGSIIGMALLSLAIAVPMRLSAGSMTRLHQTMNILVGGLSCALGVYAIYRNLPLLQ